MEVAVGVQRHAVKGVIAGREVDVDVAEQGVRTASAGNRQGRSGWRRVARRGERDRDGLIRRACRNSNPACAGGSAGAPQGDSCCEDCEPFCTKITRDPPLAVRLVTHSVAGTRYEAGRTTVSLSKPSPPDATPTRSVGLEISRVTRFSGAGTATAKPKLVVLPGDDVLTAGSVVSGHYGCGWRDTWSRRELAGFAVQ